MKIYKKEKHRGNNIYCLMHWELDTRSFQVNDNMVLFIQDSGQGKCYIHPDWKTLIKGIEDKFIAFLNEEPFSWEVSYIDDIPATIQNLIEAGEIEYTSPTY